MDTNNLIQNLKNKKVIIFIVGVLAVFFIIIAMVLLVKKGKDDTTGTNNNGTSNDQSLVYWGLWEPTSVMQPIIDEFEAANPGVTIQYSPSSFSTYESRIYARLQQTSNTGEPAPDVFRIHNTWLPKFQKYLSPLPSSIMSSSKYAELFYPTAVEDFTGKDGNIYAIPWEIDGLMVFYNKQILEQAGITSIPTDWDSFFELAQKLTVKDSSGKIKQSGLAMGTSKNIKHASEIISFLLLQEGVNIIDETKTTVTLNTAKAERVFETYTNFALGDTAVWSSTLRTDLEMFYAGTLAMMIAPSWRAFDIIEAAPNIEFDTAPLPQLKANSEEVYYSTYWGDAVNANSENATLAWKFVEFLSEKEQQLALYSNSSKIRAFGEPYSLVELNSEMEGDSYVSAIAQMAPYMKSWQMGDESFVKASLNQAITDIIENEVDIESALKEAEDTINEQLAKTNQ